MLLKLIKVKIFHIYSFQEVISSPLKIKMEFFLVWIDSAVALPSVMCIDNWPSYDAHSILTTTSNRVYFLF